MRFIFASYTDECHRRSDLNIPEPVLAVNPIRRDEPLLLSHETDTIGIFSILVCTQLVSKCRGKLFQGRFNSKKMTSPNLLLEAIGRWPAE